MDAFKAIGLMSGSSLDGLDIAYCSLSHTGGKWKYEILKTAVVPYSDNWIERIKSLPSADAKTISGCHAALGNYFGEVLIEFIRHYSLQDKIHFIASHGHTIFHFPDKKFTTQISDGAAISAQTGLPVVCDFRTVDIANGGQGTPIVPIGDLLLFADHRYCLNIGGIANISCKANDSIVAFDICAANQVLNFLANDLGRAYDENGDLARVGKVNDALLKKLNGLDFYKRAYPKSLDNSFATKVVIPVLQGSKVSMNDQLCTYTEHIAIQIAEHIKTIIATEKIKTSAKDKMLVTGGGAFNKFLVERLQALTNVVVDIPDEQTVKFKEALVMALMGALRIRNEVNVLRSVTGANKDSVGGAVYVP